MDGHTPPRHDSALLYFSCGRCSSLFTPESSEARRYLPQQVRPHHLAQFLLIILGFFLRSIHSPSTNFTFEDTLTQIGLGYTFAFLLTYARPRRQWTAFAAILVGYWLAWTLYPAPGPNFNWAAVGVPADWHSHLLSGFAAQWNKNSNLGQAFDVWFLNRLPRPEPFVFNDEGYLTLSFIPTLGTILLGLVAGRWFLHAEPKIPLRRSFSRRRL